VLREGPAAPSPLFPGGVGNTWGDKANFESLINDVSAKLFDRFPD